MNINPPKDDAVLRVPSDPRARHVDPAYHVAAPRPVSETEERQGGGGHPPPQHHDDWLTLGDQDLPPEPPAETPLPEPDPAVPPPVAHIDVKV